MIEILQFAARSQCCILAVVPTAGTRSIPSSLEAPLLCLAEFLFPRTTQNGRRHNVLCCYRVFIGASWNILLTRTISWKVLNRFSPNLQTGTHRIVGSKGIGVGAQSTLGEDIFARKNMYEKLTKCPNFRWFLPGKLSKYQNFIIGLFTPKINKMHEF